MKQLPDASLYCVHMIENACPYFRIAAINCFMIKSSQVEWDFCGFYVVTNSLCKSSRSTKHSHVTFVQRLLNIKNNESFFHNLLPIHVSGQNQMTEFLENDQIYRLQ